MPLYNFYCVHCDKPVRRILDPRQSRQTQACQVCNCPLVRQAEAPTSHNKEVIAQPHQPKDIERFSDVEKLMKERAEANHRKKD